MFAYPNGTTRDYDRAMMKFLEAQGFHGAVVAHYDCFRTEGPFSMRRCSASEDQNEFRWTLWGGEYLTTRLKELLS